MNSHSKHIKRADLDNWLVAISRDEMRLGEDAFLVATSMAFAVLLKGEENEGGEVYVSLSNKAISHLCDILTMALNIHGMTVEDLRFQFKNGYTGILRGIASAAPDGTAALLDSMIDEDNDCKGTMH